MRETAEPGPGRLGTVYLVGAGPGDPDLLTLRAEELLRRADLVLYDNLTSPEVLACVPDGAELRYVGKKRSEHAFTQAEINQMMIDAASGGSVVVRLKGGDPFIFGRGGEEAQALARAGIPFEVVPGVSSALGAAAYAGMPLTHREHTQVVAMLTGHDVDAIDWTAMAQVQTLVIFMGLVTLPEIAERLVAAGRKPDTPAAAVRWVTRGDQSAVTGTLADLPSKVARSGLKPPALVVIGEIVKLRGEIDWFDRLPLRRRTVVVTRAAPQARSLSGALRRLGAQVLPIPVIAFEPPSDWEPVDAAIRALSSYDWLVFTSANAVDRFLGRLEAGGKDLRDFPRTLCAIGPATADRLRANRLRVDVLPEQFVAESLAESLEDLDPSGRRVLLPRAEEAREALPTKLAELGASVDVVPVYRTVLPESSRALADRAWKAGEAPDWVTVTSSSTVRHLAQIVPAESLGRSRLASIGPVTTATARELGLEIATEAVEYTVDGLVAAIRACEMLDLDAGRVPSGG